MKRNRHTEEQIINILKANERGVSIAELARQNGVAEQTIYRWKAKFSGMEASGRRFRVLNIVDDFSRECVGQLVDTSISGRRLARN